MTQLPPTHFALRPVLDPAYSQTKPSGAQLTPLPGIAVGHSAPPPAPALSSPPFAPPAPAVRPLVPPLEEPAVAPAPAPAVAAPARPPVCVAPAALLPPLE